SDNASVRLQRGIELGDGERTAPADIRRVSATASNTWFEVTLRQGRNRQIRKMFDAIGHSVSKLSRIRIGSVEDSKLKPGEWRIVTKEELKKLRKPPAVGNSLKTSRQHDGRRRSK